ncbi:MAG: glutamate-cysteine ligase family protein [Sulfuricella sp.]|nr:glutamate-cysteine ligase family protein [Sulfuricella sp.]
MNETAALHAFAGYGIELEYMIVDRQTLSVYPIADELLRRAAGTQTAEVARGEFDWTNELVLHLVEIKNHRPVSGLEPLPAAFQNEVDAINRLLDPMGARLMPGAMHPWMDPRTETRLWPHQHAAIYLAYDRIFDCRQHGQANLQSMQLNLPFAGDAEFAALHAAIRLVLPIIPAIAASSPFADGEDTGFLDFRMEAYRANSLKVPSIIGQVIPETVASRAGYETAILAPMYRDIAPLDPAGVLCHEWLNTRGAAARFDRCAIEIRVIDVQECPLADLAVAALIVAAVRAVYDARWAPLSEQQEIGVEALARIMRACNREAERAPIEHDAYLRLFGFPGRRCEARELWSHLAESMPSGQRERWHAPLQAILRQGPLARRILKAVGQEVAKDRLREVYGALCDCLEQGRMFLG